MASNYGYQLTSRAVDDVNDIVSYLSVELGNPAAATGFMDLLQSAIAEIRAFPQSGPRVANEFLPSNQVRKIVINNYVMYYQPHPETEMISILRVVYGKRDINEILKKLEL